MLCVTWFNPLVYLEIVFLVGVVSSSFGSGARAWFCAGFLVASGIRFYGWSLAGRLMQPWLMKPGRREMFGLISGAALLCSAAVLARQIS
jgi:L-lysine exporter family protein LysE/ArgO